MRKEIFFSKTLLQIPYPWSITSFSKRWEERQKLDATEENFDNALLAVDISLGGLQNIDRPEGESIPTDLRENWGFIAEEIASYAYQLDILTYSDIEIVLKSNQVESPSEETLEEMAKMWIWSTLRDIANSSLTWIGNNLDEEKNSKFIKKILKISSYYWDKSPLSLAAQLIGISSRFPQRESIEFLEEVEKSSSITEQRELARDFRKLLLEKLENI
jgi:hypothetical protein